MPDIYAVASAKGGVGKTTTVANVAAALAAAGYTTVAVDGDVATPNLAATLGVEVDGPTLHDVLAGDVEPSEATYVGPHGLAVLPGDPSLEAFRRVDPAKLRDVLTSVENAAYVIVDTGAGLTHDSALSLTLADGVLLVTTPTRDALADTGTTLELTERLGGTVTGIALTRAGSEDDAEGLDAPVLGRIPEDPVVADAVAASSPLSVYAPESDAAAAYRSLAGRLVGEPIEPAPDDRSRDAVADAPGPRAVDDDTEPAVTPHEGAPLGDAAPPAGDGTDDGSPGDDEPTSAEGPPPGGDHPAERDAVAGGASDESVTIRDAEGDESSGAPQPESDESAAGEEAEAADEDVEAAVEGASDEEASDETDAEVDEDAVPFAAGDEETPEEAEGNGDDDADEDEGAVEEEEAEAADDDDDERRGFLSRLFG